MPLNNCCIFCSIYLQCTNSSFLGVIMKAEVETLAQKDILITVDNIPWCIASATDFTLALIST